MVLFLAFPLLCWVLAARTTRYGWGIGVVLALCAGAEITLAKGWALAGARITLLLMSVLASVAALVVGLVRDERRAGTGRSRWARIRYALGLVLSVLYCSLSLIAVPLAGLVVLFGGPPLSTPSGAEVLPLPSGLAVSGNRDKGCSSGSGTICSRSIGVRSTTGGSADAVVERLRDHFTQADGWWLTLEAGGDWDGCRTEGLLLDRHQVCLDIHAAHGRVTVDVSDADYR